MSFPANNQTNFADLNKYSTHMSESAYENVQQHPQVYQQPYTIYDSTPIYPSTPVNECKAVYQSTPIYPSTPVNECNQAICQSNPVCQTVPVYLSQPVYQQPYTIYDSVPVYPSTPVYQSVVSCDTIYHINNVPYICYASNPTVLYPLQYVQPAHQNSRGFGELAETVGNLAQDKIESLENYVKQQEQQMTNVAQDYVKKSCFSFA
jgi:hypothetical protein